MNTERGTMVQFQSDLGKASILATNLENAVNHQTALVKASKTILKGNNKFQCD